MACKIQRDTDNNIIGVTANNGAPSILFNEIASTKDPEDALLEYASTFTKEFTDAVEKHFANIEGNELYDKNGEVKFEVYNKIMNPEQTLLNTSLQSKFNTSKKNVEFNSKLKVALLDFIKGLNIEVNEEADELLNQLNTNPLAAFDTLQKYLALRSNISDKDLALQSANIIYTFIGKKSKLSIELWHNINKWSKYDEIYNYYYNKLLSNTSNQDDRYDSEFLLEKGLEYKGTGKRNSWAHRQVILEFIAENIKIGIDKDYFGEKRKNPDLDKDYFKKLGFADKYEENTIKRILNLFWNWINENILGKEAVNTNYSETQLQNLVLDIVDDVYKKDYSKFIRVYDRNENGDVVSLKNGELFEVKDYYKTLESNPFARGIVESLFDSPFIDYKASGSLTLRKYGKLLRALSEDLHDIDGVITYDQFKKESNALKFKFWLQSEGLFLLDNYKKTEFRKKTEAFLNQQNWYQNVKNLYPSWTLESAFIGKDHKQAESVTITGYVEHPTETEIDDKTNEIRPKRYVIDFFLRTTDDALFPEQFEDNKWKYWKGIFEAKLNMGRAKDINDLIYFEPFIKDKYKFNNKGFRYFGFAQDNVVEQAEFNREQAIVKPGVAELFESNPELANAVYEALGFESKISDVKYNRTFQNEEYHNAFVKGGLDAVKKVIEESKQKELSAAKQLSREVDLLLEFEELNNKTNKTNRENDRVIELYVTLKNSKQLDFEYSLKEIGLPNTYVKPITKVTPQQKQQALQLYSQYLDTTSFPNIEGFKEFISTTDNLEFNKESEEFIENNTLAYSTVRKIADRLSQSLGNIPYYIVDRSEAKKILEENGQAYNNEPAFFFNGQVYIVNNAFTLKNVVHEFSHPFIKALAKNNPSLFNKLYDELIQTEEGKQIKDTVEKFYKEKQVDSEGFREEVLVRALTTRATTIINKQENSSAFKKLIDKILYNLKQLFRKVFGKIKIEKLNVNTTLEELAEMLTSDKFNISIKDYKTITAEFSKETAQEANKYLKDKRSIDIQNSINDLFRLIRVNQKQIENGIRSDSSFYQIFTNTESERPFQEIIRNLKPYQTIEDSKSKIDAALNYREMQVQSFVQNLFSYEEGLDKILDEINTIISEGKDSTYALNRYSYLKSILETSVKSFEGIADGFTEQGVPVNSPIYQLVNELISKANNSVKIIKKEYQKILPDIIAPQLEGVNKVIIDSYNQTISLAESKGKSAEKIAQLKKERDSYLRDKNYITRILAGEEPEPSSLGLSAFVESAISSPDGLISSFARMFKEAMIDVELSSINNFNDFLKEVNPLLESAGVNFNTISSLGALITRVQSKGFVDPTTNEFKPKDIVELLSPFKDYQKVLSEFTYNIEQARKDGDEEKLVKIKNDREKFIRDWMHGDYLPIVYTANDVFNKTFTDSKGVVHEVGKIARERRDIILEKIKNADSIIIDELEQLEISSRLKRDSLWSEYYALYNKYMPDGQPKDEVESAITEVLLENRAERRKYFEWESDLESDSMPIKRFEKARNLFKSNLKTRFAEGSPEYNDNLREWDYINTRKVINKNFYEDKQRIILEIRELYDKINNSSGLSETEKDKIAKQNEQLEKNLLMIVDQLYGYRDEENQPNGLLISEGKAAKIKEAQEEINKLQESLKAGKGLTKQEKFRASVLAEKLKDETITPEEEEELEKLDLRDHSAKVPKAIREQLKMKFAELNELQSKYPTKYYLIAFNYKIEQLNRKLKAAGEPESKFVKTLDVFNVDEISKDVSYMNSLMRKDSEFEKWFMQNHILNLEWDQESSKYIEVYKRLPIWTEITPNDEKYFRKMTMSDGEVIYGMPTLNYYKQNIKPEYATPDIDENGLPTRDIKGNPLPRLIPNSPYINQEYFDLEKNNKPVFDLLQKITEQYFKFQQKADPSDRLGYEIPRYEKNRKELIETNSFVSGKVSGIKTIYKNIINKLQENAEDFESGLSIEDKFRLVTLDQFDDDKGKIFISGKAMIDQDQVSRDVITSILRHMFSIERASKLREIHPVANALVEVLEDPKNKLKDTSKVSMYEYVFKQGTKLFASKKGPNIRAEAIKALVERNFYNIQQTGFGSDITFLQKASRLMMAGASFGFFALDIVSAVKNRFGQQIQQAIELAAGTSYDAKSFLTGKIMASKAMMEISGSIYSGGKLPYHVQLVNAFDPSQGRTGEKLPEMVTRTIYKDAVSPLNATMSPRKFLELETTLEFFYGVMENTKVEQTINGQTTMIPYHEAFELVDGILKLKQGIDPKYDLGGSEFKKTRIFIQEKQNILNGVYSLFDQPEGNRYLFYRMFMFLRKFFVTQFLNRFGYSGSILRPRFRRNIATENIEMGYYVQSIRGLIKLFKTMGDHYHFMIPQEKAAMRKLVTEMAILTILSILVPWMLGWDEDDEEKYAKLRERQGGPLGSENFKLGGWLANHLLYQTLSVSNENAQFLDLSFYSGMSSNFNLANGPTIQTYSKILENLLGMITGDDSAYYKKDVGPYSWQKAESAKIYNLLGKAFALSGKNIDPAQTIKDFISIENIN